MYASGRGLDEAGLKLLKKITMVKSGLPYTLLKVEVDEVFKDKALLDHELEEQKRSGLIEEYESSGEKFYRATDDGESLAIADYIFPEERDGSLPPEDEQDKKEKEPDKKEMF